MSDSGEPTPSVREIVARLSQSLIAAPAPPVVNMRALPVWWVRLVLSGLVVLLGTMAVGTVAFQHVLGQGLQRVRSVAEERHRLPVPPLPADSDLLNDDAFAAALQHLPEREPRLWLGRGRALVAAGRSADAIAALALAVPNDAAADSETLLLLAQVQRDIGAIVPARVTLLRLDWQRCSPAQRQQAVHLLADTVTGK